MRYTTHSTEFAFPDSFQPNLCINQKKRNNTHLKHAAAAPARRNQRNNTFWLDGNKIPTWDVEVARWQDEEEEEEAAAPPPPPPTPLHH